ncbi:hypothetical protein [Streptomyces yunnanensis]|uniref:Uncharacterized protein n=1 Tax=Streptomyces yunnanensis TaxID=156453 RepID=A0A9X8MSB8_9ACTN|nr:hypothetical protein [Streptomyces yunnanensis]SHL61029.1 hypothetical protein SAMN05216268_105246 [Streptomyces yunnanensis]
MAASTPSYPLAHDDYSPTNFSAFMESTAALLDAMGYPPVDDRRDFERMVTAMHTFLYGTALRNGTPNA